jgi:hypothetical protein
VDNVHVAVEHGLGHDHLVALRALDSVHLGPVTEPVLDDQVPVDKKGCTLYRYIQRCIYGYKWIYLLITTRVDITK